VFNYLAQSETENTLGIFSSFEQVGTAQLVSYEVQKLANTVEVLVSKRAAVQRLIKERGVVTQAMKPLVKVRVRLHL
jgi:hypothetical protein